MSASWYYHRLRAMGPGEILSRVRLAAKKRKWRHGSDASWMPGETGFIAVQKMALGDFPAEQIVALRAEADRYLDHRWLFFGLDIKEENINWHADPVSGKQAPQIFGFDINHRDAQFLGDIKIIWEKNRHHHLSVLSATYALSGDERYSDEVARQILSWIDQNPPFIGVNWTHPLEQGIRLISWVWCERLLRGSHAHDQLFGSQSPVRRSIYQQQKFIAETYCSGSSANNHLIGEMAGLYISSRHFLLGPESEKWKELSRSVLEEELVRQTFRSGLNREQAFGYHLFVLGFGLLAYAEANDFALPAKDVLLKMLQAVPLLADAGGNLPRYGDSDDGKALQLAATAETSAKWVLDLGARLFGVRLPEKKTMTAELISQCLAIESKPAREVARPAGSHAYEDAGIYELVSRRGTEKEVFVLADAGPLGYLSIAAHGHADALSFTLSAGGLEFIVDPGTFTYYTDSSWRKYFRGTLAHNTVSLDGRDQSEQTGPMMWRRPARTRVSEWRPAASGGVLCASHDGYKYFGTTHERRIELMENRLLIRDSLTGAGRHRAELRLHFHPGCAVEISESSTVTVMRQGRRLRISLPAGMDAKILHAENDGGWYSAGFMRKEPACTLAAAAEISLPAAFETEIEVLNEN
ncbi:MAG: alginate lyase family protein [Kiritimatiellia bacterium]